MRDELAEQESQAEEPMTPSPATTATTAASAVIRPDAPPSKPSAFPDEYRTTTGRCVPGKVESEVENQGR